MGSPEGSPVPRPKSPPELYGKRRELAKVMMLEREVRFLEEELKSIDKLQPASFCIKEVADYVVTNPEPLITVCRKTRKPCAFWKWLICGNSCFNMSCVCCCNGCSLPDCCSCSLPNCSCLKAKTCLCSCNSSCCPKCLWCKCPRPKCSGCACCSCCYSSCFRCCC